MLRQCVPVSSQLALQVVATESWWSAGAAVTCAGRQPRISKAKARDARCTRGTPAADAEMRRAWRQEASAGRRAARRQGTASLSGAARPLRVHAAGVLLAACMCLSRRAAESASLRRARRGPTPFSPPPHTMFALLASLLLASQAHAQLVGGSACRACCCSLATLALTLCLSPRRALSARALRHCRDGQLGARCHGRVAQAGARRHGPPALHQLGKRVRGEQRACSRNVC
jgi:hypothetical protein